MNRVAITKDHAAATTLLMDLVEAYPGKLCRMGLTPFPQDGTIAVYLAADTEHNVHVQMAGGDMEFVREVQAFARGYLAANERFRG